MSNWQFPPLLHVNFRPVTTVRRKKVLHPNKELGWTCGYGEKLAIATSDAVVVSIGVVAANSASTGGDVKVNIRLLFVVLRFLC